MKRILILIFAGLFFCSLNAQAAELKIGYVDLQKALNMSSAGKDAKEKIGQKVKTYEGTFQDKQKELKALKDELDKQTMLLSDDARSAKEREYQQKLKDFQRMTKDAEDELKQQDADFTRGILQDLLKVVKEYGKKEGYTVIFEPSESSLLYADESIDLTEKVIQLYDAEAGKSK